MRHDNAANCRWGFAVATADTEYRYKIPAKARRQNAARQSYQANLAYTKHIHSGLREFH